LKLLRKLLNSNHRPPPQVKKQHKLPSETDTEGCSQRYPNLGHQIWYKPDPQ
jgi:hypothetical protein